MRFPSLGGTRRMEKRIPAPAGGMNTADEGELVPEYQLTRCENLHYRGGVLRSRPGVKIPASGVWQANSSERVYETADGAYTVLHGLQGTAGFFTVIDNKTGNRRAYSGAAVPTGGSGFLVEEGEGKALFFSSNGTVVRFPLGGAGSAAVVAESEMYTPLVMINAKPSATPVEADRESVAFSRFEGFNMLTRRFLTEWTTDGEGMYYAFPFRLSGTAAVTVRYTHTDGEEYIYTVSPGGVSNTHPNVKVPADSDAPVRFAYGVDGLHTENTGGAAVALPAVGYAGNLTIEGQAAESDTAGRVFDFRFSATFGSDSNGTMGGNRVMIAGNPDEGAMVRFSEAGQPLYFPENNYMYIGDVSEPVTAFGKQQSYLVVFKPRDMYALECREVEIDGEAVTAGRAPEASANAYFVSAQIVDGIGCDCPLTVRVCGNRLVWATSARRVYMLSSLGAFSSRAVRHISHMVDSDWAWESFAGATAAVFQNAYHLVLGTKVYRFDYSAAGFENNSGYASEETAARKIAWYRWQMAVDCRYNGSELPVSVRLLSETAAWYRAGLYRFVAVLADGEGDTALEVSDSSGILTYTVEDAPLLGYAETGRMTLGEAGRQKTVHELLCFASGEGSGVRFSYTTDRGNWSFGRRMPLSEDMRAVKERPRADRVRVFGVRVNTQGSVKLGDMHLFYSVLGGVK